MRASTMADQPQYCEMLSQSACRELRTMLSDSGLSVTVLDSSLLKCALPGTVAVKREDFYVKYLPKLGLTAEMLFRDRLALFKRDLLGSRGPVNNAVLILCSTTPELIIL